MQLKTFVDVAGWIGAALILGAYSLISSGKLKARSRLYQRINIVGAVGLIINGSWNTAWPSVGLNVVWLGIGAYALRRHRRAAVSG
ncbi:MAG: CBU_0592 family membrane protein [Steroidobacteraceae bacterium]